MMDTFSVIYSVAVVLPIILITGLCIGCRKKIPVHITETGYYEDKQPHTHPPSSFMILTRPQPLPRSVSSQGTMFHQDLLLTLPKSPCSESRRSSVGREIKGFPDTCDSIKPSASAPLLISKSAGNDDDDEDYDDGGNQNYINDNPCCGYIEVLPDDGATKLGPVLVVTCDVDNRASLSSVGTDENYVNVADSDEKASSADGNYVNVGDTSDVKGGSLEYVNVEEAETNPISINPESEDDDVPEYENIEKGHKVFQDKPPEPAARPEPPPPPTPGPAFRYERDLYPPNQPPGAEAPPSATQEPTTAEHDADYEEDFEEIQDLHRAQRSDVKGHNSAQSTTRGAAQQGMYANLDVSRDYVNVPDVAVEGSKMKEIPIYVKIIDSDPETNVAPGDEETTEKTPRSTINSIGKYSSHSDSLCHSYENVAMQSPPNVSELDLDYVNMTR